MKIKSIVMKEYTGKPTHIFAPPYVYDLSDFVFRLKLYKLGEWVPVVIDDYFPCYYNGQPMFTQISGNEIWPLLIEKAYAKLYGKREYRGNLTHYRLI